MPGLVLLVLGLIGPGIEMTGPARAFEPDPYRSSRLIRFAGGLEIDTDTDPGARPGQSMAPGTYWLVNLNRPVDHSILDGLRGASLQPVCYIAYGTVVCRAERPQYCRSVTRLPFVRWLGPLPAAAKLAPELVAGPVPDGLLLSVWPGARSDRVAEAITDRGGRVFSPARRLLRFTLPSDRLADIAGLDEVAWVQSAGSFEPYNNQVQWVVQIGWRPEAPDPASARPVWARGIQGQGVVVGLFDSGILTEHDQFCDPEFPLPGPGIFPGHRKIAGYRLYEGAAFGDVGAVRFHGSGVAGTLAGDDSVCGDDSKDDGVARLARIYFVDVGSASGQYVYEEDLTALLDSVRRGPAPGEPVRQASGSFGSRALLGYYRLMESTLDESVWRNKDFLVVWAAGNDGGLRWKTGHPGCAKNVLTVGATGNGTASDRVADFSSRGPTRDGRVKPTVVAPGVEVTTVDGPGTSQYCVRDGTSISSPAASGALLLLRQYLRDGWFPTGTPRPENALPVVSAALMRALAISGTDPDVGVESLPDAGAGWGRLDLGAILHFESDSVVFSFVDDTVGVETGAFAEYHFDLASRRPLKVVLAWTDTAAVPEAAVALVNDLDLEIISPDLNSYHGNQFLEGQSRANPPEWDERNVEEVVCLGLPITGQWTARVRGRSVFTGRQPYAFVVKADVSGLPGVADDRHAKPPAGIVPAVGTIFVNRGRTPHWPPGLADSPLAVYAPDGRLMAQSPRGETAGACCATLPVGVYFYRAESVAGGTTAGRLVVVDGD